MSASDYQRATTGLDGLGTELKRLIGNFLKSEGIAIHSVDVRVKTLESASKKMASKQGRYRSVEDLHDLLGVRVIAYFADDVPRIVEVISGEFEVDEGNSGDKQARLDADRFGYLSHHLVAQLDARRAQLRENKVFAGRRFEIQVRSILQHAWAEIEHDLGYKAKQGVPDQYRRAFSRLASLLELADEQFYQLRDSLNAYGKDVPAQIQRDPYDVDINKRSLEAYVGGSEDVRALDARIAGVMGTSINESYRRDFAWEAPKYALVGLKTIGDLDAAVKLLADHTVRFTEIWLARPDNDAVRDGAPKPVGISLFFLRYALVADLPPWDQVEWAQKSGIDDSNGNLLAMVEDTWAEVVAELGKPQP